MNISIQTNGKGTAQQAEDMKALLESESTQPSTVISQPAKKQRKGATGQNKATTINLDLDAGSSRCKFVVNGWSGNYPSVFKEVTGELPSGISGCFSIGNKNYGVGRVTNSLNGVVVEAFRDNKIKYLHIWLIGALTRAC